MTPVPVAAGENTNNAVGGKVMLNENYPTKLTELKERINDLRDAL